MEKISAVNYILRRHPRARRLRLTVKHNGTVVLTIPRRVTLAVANNFVQQHATWIQRKIEEIKIQSPTVTQTLGRIDFHRYQARARALITKTVHALNKHYQFRVGKISIRNQSSRWGSCSKDGNLNFNFRLFFLEEKLVHYVVIHELCHLKEMNHSARFWKLVGEIIPDYQECRRVLRKHRL